jgi:unsaturated rhamnogalacturonyl hydrolase
VDMLDYLPAAHAKRKDIIAILQRLSTALEKYQDDTGVWYQIIDKPTVAGNYREASASCMFVYAIAKGTRLGYLDKHFKAVARKGFDGLLKNFVEKDADGLVHLTKTCSGAGLGGTPYRDGSFAYYIGEPLRVDDLKGVGPFIQASIELERMTQ